MTTILVKIKNDWHHFKFLFGGKNNLKEKQII